MGSMQTAGIVHLYPFMSSRKAGLQGEFSSEMAAIQVIFMPTFPYKLLCFGHFFFLKKTHFDAISPRVPCSTPAQLCSLACSGCSGCRDLSAQIILWIFHDSVRMHRAGTAQLKLYHKPHSRTGGKTTLGQHIGCAGCCQDLSQQLCKNLENTPWAWQISQGYFRD